MNVWVDGCMECVNMNRRTMNIPRICGKININR